VALDQADDDEEATRARILWARALLRRGQFDAARATLRKARSAARGIDDGGLIALLEIAAARVESARGAAPAARRHVRSALAAADAETHPRERALALTLSAGLRRGTNTRERAAAELRSARALAERAFDALAGAAIDESIAALHLDRGDAAAAEPHLESAVAVRERAGDPARLADALVLLAALRLEQGRDAEAHSALDRGTQQAGAELLVRRDLLRGRLEGRGGHFDRARELLRSAARAAHRRGDLATEAEARARLAATLADAGQKTEARREVTRALSIAQTARLHLAEAIAQRAHATASPSRAIGYLIASVRAADRARHTAEAERSLTRLNALRQSKGELNLPPEITERLPRVASLEDEPEIATGEGDRDHRHLELMVDALRRPGSIDAALDRLRRATTSSWAVLIDHDAGDVLAERGRVPPWLRDAVGEVEGGDVEPRSIARANKRALLQIPILSKGAPTGRSVLVAGAREPVPPGILLALAAPLAGDQPSGTPRAGTAPAHGIIGTTPAMMRLFSLLERVADNELPILIQGESGTGKELVAHAIHSASPRRDRPFVPIDCAALPESLIETELFGHRKGAFTGTVNDRAGLFEEADGGTVFLDEVANIPGRVQAKLLRVLQERELRRVGDSTLRPIDVRVVAAANRPLEQAVRDGQFREDLFFRLNVIEVNLPPLRERLDDVPLLVEHFLARLGSPPPQLEPAALERLLAHDWPGNVRELENELRRAAAVARDGIIRASDLRRGERRRLAIETTEPRLRDAVAALERRLITSALEANRGHRARTARQLGLSHQGLINKIRKYGLSSTGKSDQDT